MTTKNLAGKLMARYLEGGSTEAVVSLNEMPVLHAVSLHEGGNQPAVFSENDDIIWGVQEEGKRRGYSRHTKCKLTIEFREKGTQYFERYLAIDTLSKFDLRKMVLTAMSQEHKPETSLQKFLKGEQFYVAVCVNSGVTGDVGEGKDVGFTRDKVDVLRALNDVCTILRSTFSLDDDHEFEFIVELGRNIMMNDSEAFSFNGTASTLSLEKMEPYTYVLDDEDDEDDEDEDCENEEHRTLENILIDLQRSLTQDFGMSEEDFEQCTVAKMRELLI